MEEQDKQKEDVLTLGNAFIQDVQDRATNGYSIPHRTKNIFTVYIATGTQ